VSEEEFTARRLSSLSVRGEDILYLHGQRPAVIRETGNDVLYETSHEVTVRKQKYRTGIPNPRLWPQASPYIDVALATFGYASPEMKKYWEEYQTRYSISNPLQMVTVFISMHDTEKMRRRLYDRCRKENIDFGSKWAKNEEHFGDDFASLYDHVVYNDGTVEECVRQLEVIAGP
jgi:UDP-2,3-diacylglucosamine pyrophosphatase LpxH